MLDTIKAIGIVIIIYLVYYFGKRFTSKPEISIVKIKASLQKDKTKKNKLKNYLDEKQLQKLMKKIQGKK